ncbi:TPA: oxidative stress defense protein [Vibrio parahaemolyticus]|uniref:oxidative stress defense protein n=1 Tax=Vibrio parahaemolyticus TaxID=670 RepID=UPI0009987BE9|nr:oxidative stress defense protein [Vibrio parahaemolyticus]EGQ9919552.1 oxidative stress defense protein [Vibrio parahaemolyticus]EGR2180497.1 oxidative stress defense protein [Vibrio parahaemolyticus]EIU6758745.1 oxidative stress defense protein [Vibrio parahaemolyticus]EIV8645135.1 oxidative stress defense protein [Vibrio parahaemolyticus]EIV8674944.1 oxidative stress defense protein [Vibrio parahaemolyticus]
MKLYSCLLASALSLSSVSVLADVPEFAHVTTTGYGEVVATPDMATFSVKVVDTTMTAEQAKQSVDKTVEDFLQYLSDAGLSKDNITSSNLYLAPQYHYPKSGKAELVGYRASRSINVTVTDLADLNQYLDMALKAGINQVDNIQLKVSNQAEYQQKARMAAIKDAREKAASLASGFDKKLGGIWQINYNQMHVQPVLMRSMSMDSKQGSNSYQDSTLVIRDQVDVVYKLK